MDVEELLSGLGPLQRQAAGMTYFEQRTLVDVAYRLGVDRDAVASALSEVYRRVAARVMADEAIAGVATTGHDLSAVPARPV